MSPDGMMREGLLSNDAALRDTGFCLPDFVDDRPSGPSIVGVFAMASRFCAQCGSPHVKTPLPALNEPPRLVCVDCGSVHYLNPRIVVRCIAESAGLVLLCQRADEPRRARWSTPGGYVESGEEIYSAAARETREEAGVMVDDIRLAAVYEFPQINEIIMICVARVRDRHISLGAECSDARFFSAADLPTTDLAFPTDSEALRRYFAGPSRERPAVQLAQFFWERDGRILVRDR
jgi:ADP-ribose pyrophosphatase YjhB (NUDIX family)